MTEDDSDRDRQALLQDIEVRRQLRSVVDLLESGLSELVKIAAELRSLIRTIDDVTKQVESQCGVGLGKDCCGPTSWWPGRDINQNVPTAMSEVHWQTYASHDWFSGFKRFPRLKDAKESIASFAKPSDVDVPCKYYDQVAEVLLQIGKILNSLETSHSCSDNPACSWSHSDVNANETISSNSLAAVSEPQRLPQDCTHHDTSCWRKASTSTESSADLSQNSYLSVLVDVNGDYEETVDYLLETLAGTHVEEDEEMNEGAKKEDPSDAPPPVPVVKFYFRKKRQEQDTNSAMDNLQTYFD